MHPFSVDGLAFENAWRIRIQVVPLGLPGAQLSVKTYGLSMV